MRTHGTISRWNDERGFGFITPAANGTDVFVHVSAFPKGGDRPRNGELVSYEVETVRGRPQAVRIARAAGKQPQRRAPPDRIDDRRSGRWSILATVVVVALGVAAFNAYERRVAAPSTEFDRSVPAQRLSPAAAAPAAFRCDGRTSCPAMRSCEEARFFLAHCPNTQMDGDLDGEPCEEQWCR